MEKLDRTFNIFLVCCFFILAAISIIMLMHDEGEKRIIQMQQMIKITGATTDADVERIGKLFGVKPQFDKDYDFWKVVKIGVHSDNDPSPVEVSKALVEIKTSTP